MSSPTPSDQPQSPGRRPQRWHETAGDSQSKTAVRSSRRGRKIFWVLAGMLALVGAVVAWFLLSEEFREPYFLTLSITEHLDPLFPANPLAAQDSQVLRERFRDGKNASASQERHLLLRELEALRTRLPKDTVVIHLNGHAWYRSARPDQPPEVYLLPSNAQPDDPETWLSLRQVLQMLGSCPAQHKLLLLDLMQPLADTRLGVLTDDVADQVLATVEKEQDPQRLVLSACAPGQISLASEEMGQTVFGYYLDQGLRGRADGYNPTSNRDDFVSVRELAAFVRQRVDRWARHNRQRRQTPVASPEPFKDFLLVPARPNPDSPDEESPAPAYPMALLKGWEQRDLWWKEKRYRIAPQAYQHMETTLLRAEQRRQGEAEAAGILRNCEATFAQARDVLQPEPRSLALLQARGKTPEAAASEALRGLVAKLEAGAKPPDAEKAKTEFLDKFKAKALDVASAVVELAVADPQPARLRLLKEVLGALQPPPRYVETLYVQRLAELEERNWPANAVRQALLALQQAERVATAEPQVLPWVRDLLDQAQQKQQEGERFLFQESRAARPQAELPLTEAVQRYSQVNQRIESIQDAYRTYDEAWAVLPGYASYLVAQSGLDPQPARSWQEAVDAAEQLGNRLATGAPEDLPAISNLRGRLAKQLALLVAPFAAKAVQSRLGQFRQDHAGDYVETQALLQCVRLGAKDREQLWLMGRRLASNLHKQTHDLDQQDDPRTPGKQVPGEGVLPEAGISERERALLRARVAIDLLRLAGVKEAQPLRADLEQAQRQPGQRAKDDSLVRLGVKLRQAWLSLGREDTAGADRSVKERLGRLLPLLRPGAASLPPGSLNWTAQLRQQEARAFWSWFGQRYALLSQTLAGKGPSGDQLSDFAREYQQER